MLGGIYGDLAASTYLRDPKVFYSKLFDEKATLSEYGLSIVATIALVTMGTPREEEAREALRTIIKSYFGKADNKLVQISMEASSWIYDFGFRSPTCSGMLLNRLATYAVLVDNPEDSSFCVMIDRSSDKEEGYARIFVSQIIYNLRQGYTKDEVYEKAGDIFRDIRRTWPWKEQNTTLCILMRAWDCFYNSFDFGSAIHNAVRYPNSNTRQLASLTGLIAEAMYGCSHYFKKEKYCSGNERYVCLSLPTCFKDEFKTLLTHSYEVDLWEKRVFFPKNCALTNVERHQFKPYKSRLNGMVLLPESKEKIWRAFHTGWEDRFGFYLDDGWIYCYRSFYLLGRFKLTGKDGRYVVACVQQTEQMPGDVNIDLCIACALHSARVAEAPDLEDIKL